MDSQTRTVLLMLAFVTILASLIAVFSRPKIAEHSAPAERSKKAEKSPYWDDVKGGVHQATGLIADTHFELVINHCTACHSANLIIQNRQTADGWVSIIRWMQEKQNLWDLGADEDEIVAYLAKHYAPKTQGRRKNLEIAPDQWYELEN
jgi:cytochrome c1